MKFRVTDSTQLRVLDFDIENRPLSYLGSDFTTAEITAIAAGWDDEDHVAVWVLRDRTQGPTRMLRRFRELWDKAGMVTGHNIRRHDIPIINGALLEAGLSPLTEKLVSDTYGDLIRRSGISSSQESLAGMFGLNEHKHHMSQAEWREANRLTPAGIELTIKRVESDVRQHKALRRALLDAGALKHPKLWRP